MDFQIEITKAVSSRINEIDFNNLVFGKNYTDHMFVAEYIGGNWQNARVVPFGNLRDRKSTRLNSSHTVIRMPSSA